MQENLVNSVKKAFGVLDILAFEDIHQKGTTLTLLSQKTGIRPNTLHNILKTMIVCGYVQQNEHSHYLIGNRCRQIGVINQFRITPQISNILDIEMHSLLSNISESASFYVLVEGERINYTNIESNDIIKVDYSMLEQNSIYDYPTGKILVAYCSDEERAKIISRHGYPKNYWNNIENENDLNVEINKVKAHGYLKKVSANNNVISFAVPVIIDDDLFGSLGVYMPTYRHTAEKEQNIIIALKNAAENIKKSGSKIDFIGK